MYESLIIKLSNARPRDSINVIFYVRAILLISKVYQYFEKSNISKVISETDGINL